MEAPISRVSDPSVALNNQAPHHHRTVLVQREMESGRCLLASIAISRAPVWKTPTNLVAGKLTLLNLQLVSKKKSGWPVSEFRPH